MPRIYTKKENPKLRGIWGSGDSHGNTPPLLKTLKYMLSKSLPPNNLKQAQIWWTDKKLNIQGELVLVKIKKVGLDKIIKLLG